jgi:hypothetical protein
MPMEFVDATLVLLADHVASPDIATLDRRGFSTHRTAKGKRFRLVLDVLPSATPAINVRTTTGRHIDRDG